MNRLSSATFAAAALCLSYSAVSAGPDFAGSWFGKGTITFVESRKSESAKCNSHIRSGVSAMSVVVTCGGSDRTELRANASLTGNKMKGSWEERTYHTFGELSGTFTDTSLQADFEGGGIGGTINMRRVEDVLNIRVDVWGKMSFTIAMKKRG